MKLKLLFILILLAGLVCISPVAAKGGFDQYGYNYQARIFVGPSDGYDRILNNDPIYGNDHLVMKWSKEWDDARFHNGTWGPGAWVSNEWNGKVEGGSGDSEHCKIVWYGPCSEGVRLEDGGVCIWGQFKIIMDQYSYSDGTHDWITRVSPNGYGYYK